jgi:MFS family permease
MIKALFVSRFSTLSSHKAARTGTGLCWPILLALCTIALFVQGCTLMSLGVFLPTLAADFGGHAGGALTAFLLAMSIANLPVGWALDHIGARRVLLTGLALSVIGFAGAAFARQLIWLDIAMIVTGAGVAASTIVPGIAIITHHHVERRGLALALFLGAAVIAGALVPPFIGAAIVHWNWPTAMLLGALAMGLTAPLLLLVPGGTTGGHAADTPPAPWTALLSRPFWLVVTAMVLLQLSINGVLFAAVDIVMTQGWSQPFAIATYSSANLLGLPALLLGGVLADRLGARPLLIATALGLALGTATLLDTRAMGLAGVAAFVLIWGVASALPGQSGSMLLAQVVPPHGFARALGLNTAVIGLIGALAPVITDRLRATGGGYDLPLLFYAGLALAAGPILLLVRPSKADPH